MRVAAIAYTCGGMWLLTSGALAKGILSCAIAVWLLVIARTRPHA